MVDQYEDDVIANDYGEVRLCECGGINLVIGPMTLHIEPGQIVHLAALVKAAERLNASAAVAGDC